MKILIAGDWHSDLHEQPLHDALMALGHEVYKFSWYQYFKFLRTSTNLNQSQKVEENNFVKNLSYRFQNKYMFGPIISNLNNDLIHKANLINPDVIFIYRGSHILKKTLVEIKISNPSAILIGYNNDDPFSPLYPIWKWRHFKSSISIYDLMLSYRKSNIKDYYRYGAKNVKLFRSWFVKNKNFITDLTDEQRNKYECDVVFVGHYENDGRINYLEEIEKCGFKLKIFGPEEWNEKILKSKYLKKHFPVSLVWDNDYNLALNGAKIALCFFSKLNRDTYTRRVFEITATKTLLLSEYTDEMSSLFESDKEAIYFSSKDEMIEKIKFLLNNDRKCQEISNLGYKKVFANLHSINDRAIELTQFISELKK